VSLLPTLQAISNFKYQRGKTVRRFSIYMCCFLLALSSDAVAQTIVSTASIQTSDALALPSQQTARERILSGVITTQQNELVAGVSVIARFASGEQKTQSDAEGNFRLTVPGEPLTLRFEGQNIAPLERSIGASDSAENLRIRITYVIPPIERQRGHHGHHT
jgi:hypothetical protein